MCLAIPGRVENLVDNGPLDRVGAVRFGGIEKKVNLSFVPEVVVGDYVLVHVGVAISRIDECEAERVFQYLQELGELELDLEPENHS